jgi:hypothetical protein
MKMNRRNSQFLFLVSILCFLTKAITMSTDKNETNDDVIASQLLLQCNKSLSIESCVKVTKSELFAKLLKLNDFRISLDILSACQLWFT